MAGAFHTRRRIYNEARQAVLQLLEREGDVRQVEIADRVGYGECLVKEALADMAGEGLVCWGERHVPYRSWRLAVQVPQGKGAPPARR